MTRTASARTTPLGPPASSAEMRDPLRVAACVGCAEALTVGSEVCGRCGTPQVPSERRVVTLLFADLAGYTSLCETRDPEQVHLLVRPVMNALRGIC